MAKKVLLIADDDEMNRMIIRKFLKDSYELIEAVDGQQTMELIEAQHVDVLLLDIIMPKLDGLEVLKRIREDERYADMAVLVATSTKEKTERQALSLGADDIVAKPYDPVVIHKRLENIIAIKEIQKQKRRLISDDYTAALAQDKRDLYEKTQESVAKIAKLADVLGKNKDNKKLVAEMAESIKLETEKLNQLLIE